MYDYYAGLGNSTDHTLSPGALLIHSFKRPCEDGLKKSGAIPGFKAESAPLHIPALLLFLKVLPVMTGISSFNSMIIYGDSAYGVLDNWKLLAVKHYYAEESISGW